MILKIAGWFPPIPDWDALHVVVVHLPIGALISVPLLLVLSLVSKQHGRCFSLAALAVMLLGTAGTYIAVATGNAAGALVDRSAEEGLGRVLDRHEELAEKTRLVFTLLTVIYAGMVIAPAIIRRQPRRLWQIAPAAVFLAAYLAGVLLLANTAHLGGRLVHEFNQRAMLPKEK